MNYLEKYKKYKNKYISLKLQTGGAKYDMLLNQIILNKKRTLFKGFLRDDFNPDDYKDKLEKIRDMIKNGNFDTSSSLAGSDSFFKQGKFIQVLSKYIDSNQNSLIEVNKLRQYLGISDYKECSVNELMSLDNKELHNCTNISLVRGSCGDPSFENSNNEISIITRDNYLKLFNLIEKVINTRQNITDIYIRLGQSGVVDYNTKFVTISINPDNSYTRNLDENIKYLEDNYLELIKDTTPLSINIKENFPLAYAYPNSKIVLDKILELNKIKPVNILNGMCGTCHRSLYYLVKKGISSYKMKWHAGEQDSHDILTCFKDTKK